MVTAQSTSSPCLSPPFLISEGDVIADSSGKRSKKLWVEMQYLFQCRFCPALACRGGSGLGDDTGC